MPRPREKRNSGQFESGTTAVTAGSAGGSATRQRRPITQAIISFLNEDHARTKISKLRVMSLKIVDLAVSGDMDAIKFVTERVEGKVPQAVELTGRDGGPVEQINAEMTPAQAAQAYAATLANRNAGLAEDDE